MKRSIILLLILLGICCKSWATIQNQGNYVKVVQSTPSYVIVELVIDSYSKNLININEQGFVTISSAITSSCQPKGFPDVPSVSRNFIIPAESACSVEVIESEYDEELCSLAPSRGVIMRNVDVDTVPYTFSEVYERDEYFPSELAIVGKPYLMRDVRGCAITFHAFQYNPVKRVLRAYHKMVVKVSFEGRDERNVAKASMSQGKSFKAIFKNQFMNYDQIFGGESNENHSIRDNSVLSSVVSNSEKMLVITCDSFATDMRDFVIHKNNLGLETEMVRMSQVGSTAVNVADYIQGVYDSDSTLTYVLLVGDEEMVPTIMCVDDCDGEGGSDPSYSLLSGDDNHPDIIVGRFCAHTKDEIRTMVQRTIWHECNSDQLWHHRGIGIASQDFEANSQTGVPNTLFDYEYMRRVRSMLLASHYQHVYELYDGTHGGEDLQGDPSAEDVQDVLEEGVSIVNYLGHGYAQSWETSGYDVTDLDELHNELKLPFVFSVACNVGDFTNSNPLCLAEKWLVSRDCITHNPVGAVGFYGASKGQTWSQPIDALLTFNELLATSDTVSYGALCFQSSNAMLEQHGDTVAFVFKMWNYFGDPSLSIIPYNNVGKTTFVKGNISDNTTFADYYIDIHNAVVQPNAHVSVAHEVNTRIEGPFLVCRGSSFDIHQQNE